MSTAPILLIEDTPSLQMVYETLLSAAGHEVRTASDAGSGRAAFRAEAPSAVLLDLLLPDGDGLELMSEMLTLRPEVPVIVITANGSMSVAVNAMRAGAHDFLVKPFDEARLLNAVANALAGRLDAPHVAPERLAADPLRAPGDTPGDFIGTSPAMRDVYGRIRSVGRSMASVFITGESGTGKELCAEAVHAASPRATGPFVPLNCAAIPAELLESEVFGHLRGSFTGAISDKIGAAQAADGGTLFLDEVCEMDMNLQTKLLRFLQTSTIQPVGASRPHKVNVRIVCATNRDPLEAVRTGRFREDLYYRLHVVPIHMPPLRERESDVIEIAEQMLSRFAREEGRHFQGLSEEVKARFRSYAWPGNVRQLLNVLLNVVVLHDGRLVTPAMLPETLRLPAAPPPLRPGQPEPARSPQPESAAIPAGLAVEDLLGRRLAEIERIVIERTLALHNGSVPRAARTLDVSPSTLYRKLEAWARQATGD